MATGITLSTTSNLASGQAIMIANAIVANEPSAPDPSLVEQERIPAGHKQWDVLTYARLSDATQVTEGVDLAATQQLVAAYLSVNPAVHGILVTLSKRAMRRQPGSLERQSGSQMGVSMRAREAKDIIALYDGFTTSDPGAGLALDIANVRGGVAYLLNDNDSAYGPAEWPLRGALHIEQISDFIADLAGVGMMGSTADPSVRWYGAVSDNNAGITYGEGLSADLVQRWWRGTDRLFGVQFFHSGYISRDASDDAKGAIFSRRALYEVQEEDAEPTTDEDPSARTIEYGLFQGWGEAERVDVHGVEIYSDAVATFA